ncbi:hypothetical protein KJS94_15255 [Flavihumibacter rivuli]|uniref:hypothetical protein n=1 Tax=Flavihumibacter rivuli TaxID=2838156 RepID=UPI001BDF2F40|nr:hypothetical protein [Flavihumibacter rivuli]ULQ56005.1 hypothetical protein KJS94_15255 [Flavihumibacter rivuli]
MEKADFTITILLDPNGYEGNIAVNSNSTSDMCYYPSPTRITVKTGENYLNTGASIGFKDGPATSYIYFTIGEDGLIQDLSNSGAAAVNGNRDTIILKTDTLSIQPDGKDVSYYITAMKGQLLTGRKDIRLVKSQIYTIDSGSHLEYQCFTGRSSFLVTMHEDGAITTNNRIASAGGQGKLLLKSTAVEIDPDELNDGQAVLLPDNTIIAKKSKHRFIRGLLTVLLSATNHDKLLTEFIPL